MDKNSKEIIEKQLQLASRKSKGLCFIPKIVTERELEGKK